MSTKIQWTDDTINPVVGCSKISSGCQNCYAEAMARRLAAMGKAQYAETIGLPAHMPAQSVDVSSGRTFSNYGWNGRTAFVPSELEKPRKWKKPRTIFVGSMGDLFHVSADVRWLVAIMEMAAASPQHTFIFLTKRPEAMKRFMDKWTAEAGGYLQNLVLGVSVEDQKTANERIQVLIATPAAKRFVSLEPMVGPVSLRWLCAWPENAPTTAQNPKGSTNELDGLRRLDGVILGGESGSKARPLDPAWVRSIRDQCAAACVPFMFKQWGKNVLQENGRPWEFNCETGFPLLDGRTHADLAWNLRAKP